MEENAATSVFIEFIAGLQGVNPVLPRLLSAAATSGGNKYIDIRLSRPGRVARTAAGDHEIAGKWSERSALSSARCRVQRDFWRPTAPLCMLIHCVKSAYNPPVPLCCGQRHQISLSQKTPARKPPCIGEVGTVLPAVPYRARGMPLASLRWNRARPAHIGVDSSPLRGSGPRGRHIVLFTRGEGRHSRGFGSRPTCRRFWSAAAPESVRGQSENCRDLTGIRRRLRGGSMRVPLYKGSSGRFVFFLTARYRRPSSILTEEFRSE